ncbi:hypothetical protein [Sulfurimonas sp.]
MLNFSDILLSENEKTQLSYELAHSPYSLVVTNMGRLYLCHTTSKNLLYRVCSYKGGVKSYIGAISAYKNYVACSGYGGEIKIIKLSSLEVIQEFVVTNKQITALLYFSQELLISGDAQGVISLHLLLKENTHHITTPLSSITSIIKAPTADIILVGDISGKIILINIKTKKLISNNFAHYEYAIESLMLLENSTLKIGLQNNTIKQLYLPTAKDFRELVLDEEIAKSYELLDSFAYLQNTIEAKKINELYKKLYSNAINALINGDDTVYKSMYAIFETLPNKLKELKKLYRAYENYEKFSIYIQEKKYNLAYILSEKFPALQCTQLYSTIQELFKKNYAKAQKQILLGNEEEAKSLLSPFILVVQKREQIQLLLRKNSSFIAFLQAVAYKEYPTIKKLLYENQEFSQIPSYKALIQESNLIVENIKQLLLQANIDELFTLITRHQNNFIISSDLKSLYKDALNAKLLFEAYEENNFLLCYEILDKNSSLQNLELSQLLEIHYNKLIYTCEIFALDGDMPSIKNSLKELIALKSRSKRIGLILRRSFFSKILTLLHQNNLTNAQNFIYSYIDIFGVDKEIKNIMKKYEKISKKKLAITLTQEIVYSKDSWMDCELIVEGSHL